MALHAHEDPNHIGIFTRSGKACSYVGIQTEKVAEYPMDWFYKPENAGKKPLLRINLSQDSNLETSRIWAYGVVSGANVSVVSAVEYVFHLMSKIDAILEEDWVSFGRVIPKGRITPLNLIDVEKKITDRIITLASPVIIEESNDAGLLLHLAAMYRIARSNIKQEKALADKIDPVLKTMVTSTYTARLGRTRSHASSLTAFPELDILFAALDMFLYRFPRGEYSRTRYGTLILRHLGFSAFNDISCMRKLLSVDSDLKAFEWFFTTEASNELYQITKKREELDNEHSYVHYGLALGLTEKSPFAAASNPNIHFIVHALGSLLHNIRSLNAILPPNIAYKVGAINAAIIYLEAGLQVQLAPAVMDDASYRAYHNDFKQKTNIVIDPAALLGAAASGGVIDKPMNKAVIACKKYTDSQCKFTLAGHRKLSEAIATIPETRPDTIGDWMKTTFMTYIEIIDDLN